MSNRKNYKKKDRENLVNQGQVYGVGISGQNIGKSVHIGNNTGSLILTGNVGGNIENKVENSFNTYTKQQKQSLTEAVLEIRALLKQLEQSYPKDTTTSRMKIAIEAIEHIDNDSKLTQKIIIALKVGGISALEQLVNHPAARFFFAALEDWKQSKL